jgi:hypothetical protein
MGRKWLDDFSTQRPVGGPKGHETCRARCYAPCWAKEFGGSKALWPHGPPRFLPETVMRASRHSRDEVLLRRIGVVFGKAYPAGANSVLPCARGNAREGTQQSCPLPADDQNRPGHGSEWKYGGGSPNTLGTDD